MYHNHIFFDFLISRYSPVLLVTSVTTTTNANYLMRAQNQGTSRFTIRADGLVNVHAGGLKVTGGTSIQSGGIKVAGGERLSYSTYRIVFVKFLCEREISCDKFARPIPYTFIEC